ncbi:MSHA biogenesis protein MshP [Vibrio sp. LaRot3]|uniref:MSHA biogenesis protein MshP n=1 Tax=Vibrio sp. LaRot3 TaxID=2998829 RepID=UPI0022CE12EA|nr:MSHA biogenesis protein MshP [Vibrio sp. LaRot3]MDA0147873.1 MSHA biogenesis protein MshP [Vibrio sp. LaRot3]
MSKFLMHSRKQQGSAMIVILFVTVIATFFAAQLLQMNSQSQHANTYEVLSTRAYWAARSVVEKAVYDFVPVTGTPATTCPSVTSLEAYPNCQFDVQCQANGSAVIITSSAICSEDAFRVSRKFEVEVRP